MNIVTLFAKERKRGKEPSNSTDPLDQDSARVHDQKEGERISDPSLYSFKALSTLTKLQVVGDEGTLSQESSFDSFHLSSLADSIVVPVDVDSLIDAVIL
jgi:hypothetical protein